MTIKDWKKTKGKTFWFRPNPYTVWTKKDKNVVYVIETGKYENYYYVSIDKNYKDIVDKTFKTKAQGIKFAKNYMRTH